MYKAVLRLLLLYMQRQSKMLLVVESILDRAPTINKAQEA